MARYLAEAKEDDALSTRYQRVRVAQQLVATVTSAFYRLMALEQALPKAQALERNWAGVVRDLGDLAERGLVERRELLAARDELAQARQVLGDTYADMGKQREILAAAMNVCPDSCFSVTGNLWPLPRHCLDSCKLEAAALVNRPEAYQADLTHLISVADHRRALVKLLPRVEGYIGHRRDENKFILNNDWVEGGVRATWDLMEFAANLLEKRAAEGKMLQTEREAAAISMGIISQVRLKTLEAAKALEELKKFEQLLAQAREQLRIAREVETTKDRGAPGGAVMRIDRQRARCKVLKAEIDRLLAVGEVHAAFAALDAAAGLNYSVKTVQPHTVSGPRPLRAVLAGSSRILNGAARIVGSLKPW
jgi:outer membrane protein TolC